MRARSALLVITPGAASGACSSGAGGSSGTAGTSGTGIVTGYPTDAMARTR